MEKERQKMISELDEYIAMCKSRLGSILATLDWTEEETLKESTCLKDLPRGEQQEDKDDPLLPESFGCMHSIVIDENQLKVILQTNNVSIPKKFSDIQLNYTREQKRELYDYVIYNTGKISEPELKVSVSKDNQNSNDMTFAEIVAKAKKKDKKLKRKYRTSKPTHIEEVRNLVHLQMQALAQYFNPKIPSCERSFKDKDEKRPRVSERTRRRSESRSSERGGSSNLHRRSRNRSRDEKNRNKEKARHNRDTASRSRDARSKSKRRASLSRDFSKRQIQGKSPIRSTSRSRSLRQSSSHAIEKHINSCKKKSKKRSRSHSKHQHKSSKSKKSKHRHRELQKEKQIKHKD